MGNGVSLCMIVKNERARLGQLLAAVVPELEEIHVVDTGSTDGTVSLVERLARGWPQLQLHHWRPPRRARFFPFAEARNHSFSLATKEWILYLDGDDRVDGRKLRRFKRRMLNDPHVDVWNLRYVCATNHDGSPYLVADRERFIRRSVHPRWVGGVHAALAVDAGARARFSPHFEIVQDRTGKADPTPRNAAMLRAELARHPNNMRALGNLGLTLYDLGDLRAIPLLERFLRRPGRHRAMEIDVRFSLGEHLLTCSRVDEAEEMAFAIYRLDPSRYRAESFYLFGAVEQQRGNLEDAIHWYERCLLRRERPRAEPIHYYSTSDLCTWKPLRRIAECWARLGRRDRARAWALRAARHLPNDAESRRWRARLLGARRQRPRPS
jgi:glycosyltransferase involved in cell wall biosynthesis